MCAKLLQYVLLCVTLWTTACQTPLSMGFSRYGYWNGLPCPPPGDLPGPGNKPMSVIPNLHWQVASLPLVLPGEHHMCVFLCVCVCVCVYKIIYV